MSYFGAIGTPVFERFLVTPPQPDALPTELLTLVVKTVFYRHHFERPLF